MYYNGKKEMYPGVVRIEFEGVKSKNSLAFRWYNPESLVEGKRMKDNLRFAIDYWHSFCGGGSDPFGNTARFSLWKNAESDDNTSMKRELDHIREKWKLSLEQLLVIAPKLGKPVKTSGKQELCKAIINQSIY